MKRLFFIFAFFILFTIILPSQTHAQGTYTCILSVSFCHADNATSNCDSNFEPGTSCAGLLGATCTNAGPFPCVPTLTTAQLLACNATNPLWPGVLVAGINTAIGCIPYIYPGAFVGWMLVWALGIGGGIAFLLIVASGIKIMTSSGNPDKIKDGKESLTAAVSGLLLIIFSAFILRVIGLNILNIPGI